MTIFFNDPAVNVALHEWIHANYGRKSKLHKDEYMVHFDQELTWNGSYIDMLIKAGKIVHICLRCLPTPEQADRFQSLLKHAFNQNLREFKRSTALVRKSDAIKWYALAFTKPEEERPKKVKVNSFERIVCVKLVDKRTKKEVIVEMANTNYFDAQDLALRILYGEKAP